MLFSVIIPVYNAAEYIENSASSVLSDPGQDFELILVDDGSRDESADLCDKLAKNDSRVQAIHQENAGPGAARNAGLESATGEYVLFVDSDDALAPGALDRLRETVAAYHPDIVSFDYFSDDGSETVKPEKANYAPENQVFSLENHPEFLLSKPAVWARLWRKSLFFDNDIRYPERAYYGEDLQTSLKLFASAGAIVYLPEALYRYLDRPGSLMNAARPERNRSMLTAFADLADWYAARGILNRYQKELEALAIDHLLMAATVRVAKADSASPLLREIREFMEERFPQWRKNPSVANLTKLRRLALWLIERKHYTLLGWLFRMKG